MLPQIVDPDFNESAFPAPADDTEIEGASEEFREDRNNIKEKQILPSSFIQIPKPFRQFHIDSSLIQIDRLQIFLSERDQRFFLPAIDLQYLRPAGAEDVGDVTEVFPAGCVDAAPFQLKGVKPTFGHRRQRVGGDPDLPANIPLGLGDGIDAFELGNAPAMLPPEQFNLRLFFPEQDPAARLEGGVFLEQLLDSDLPFEALGSGDPRDGYIGGFRLTDEALLQDLEREPLFQLHSGRAENGSDRSGCSTLLTDDFTQVALSNSQLKDRRLFPFDWLHSYLVRIIHKRFRDLLNELLHSTSDTRFCVELEN
jgi:hypothetical protein